MSLYDIYGNVISSGETGSDNSLLWNLEKWSGKHLVTVGNSLVESTNWGQYTADYLAMEYHNLGASGSNIVHGQTTMEGIKTLVAAEFPEQADLIIIQGDSNVGNIDDLDPSDQMDGSNPKNTWSSRINYFIRCLKAKYPNVVIVLMADSVRYDSYKSGGQYFQNPPAPNVLYEPNRNNYIAMKTIAEYNRHHFWSFDGDTPFNPTNYGNEYVLKTAASNFTENDGTHPSGYFAQAKGYALAWWIGQLSYHPAASNTFVEGWENLVTASVTNTLAEGITNNNIATNIQYYMPYLATLTGVTNVTVTMGGVDITNTTNKAGKPVYSNGVISILRVTGDIVITAS